MNKKMLFNVLFFLNIMSFLRRFLRSRRPSPQGDASIERGHTFVRIDDNDRYFEAEFFKYAAAPQYLVKYCLEDNQPQWHCTCPDFIYRRMVSQTMCKHCQGAAMSVMAPTPFVNAHITPITPEEYTQLMATPIGHPLPLVGRTVRMRVEITGEPGYVAYTNRKWRCYTCGGPSGVKYLKGKQCKHIACYTHSLEDDTYEQYITVMATGSFRGARNRQTIDRKANWQRF